MTNAAGDSNSSRLNRLSVERLEQRFGAPYPPKEQR